MHAMQDNRHLLVSSNDTVRLWDLENKNFTIVPSMGSSSSVANLASAANGAVAGAQGMNGATVNGAGSAGLAGYTNFVVDAKEKYLFASSGSRGWLENGREEVGTFEIETAR